MQHTVIFHGCKIDNFQLIFYLIFSYFCSKLDCGFTVLTSTHNLCFRAKLENNVYPCKPQFYFIYIKWGVRGCKLHGQVSMMHCSGPIISVGEEERAIIISAFACGLCNKRSPLPLGAWDGLCFFI